MTYVKHDMYWSDSLLKIFKLYIKINFRKKWQSQIAKCWSSLYIINIWYILYLEININHKVFLYFFLSDLFLSFLDHKSSFSHNVINTALKFQAKSGDFVDLKCNLSQQISTYDASQQNILQLHTNKDYFSWAYTFTMLLWVGYG